MLRIRLTKLDSGQVPRGLASFHFSRHGYIWSLVLWPVGEAVKSFMYNILTAVARGRVVRSVGRGQFMLGIGNPDLAHW